MTTETLCLYDAEDELMYDAYVSCIEGTYHGWVKDYPTVKATGTTRTDVHAALHTALMDHLEALSDLFDAQIEADARSGKLASLWSNCMDAVKSGRTVTLDVFQPEKDRALAKAERTLNGESA